VAVYPSFSSDAVADPITKTWDWKGGSACSTRTCGFDDREWLWLFQLNQIYNQEK